MSNLDEWADGYIRVRPFPLLRQEVLSVIKSTKSLRRILKLKKPRIFYFQEREDNSCATYCAGSCNEPVIGLCASSFADVEESYLGIAVWSSIVHELFHAYLETLGVDCCEYIHPEEKIEDLTRDYCDGVLTGKEIAKCLEEIAQEFIEI